MKECFASSPILKPTMQQGKIAYRHIKWIMSILCQCQARPEDNYKTIKTLKQESIYLINYLLSLTKLNNLCMVL